MIALVGLVGGSLWFIGEILAAPFDPAVLTVSTFVFVGVLLASFGTLLVGLSLAGGAAA